MRFLLPACLLAAGCVNIPAFQGGGSGSGNPDGGPGSGLQLRVLDHAYYDGDTTMTGSPGMSQTGYAVTPTGVHDGELVLFLGSLDNGNPHIWTLPPGFTQISQVWFGTDHQTLVSGWKIADHELPYAETYAHLDQGSTGAACTISLLAVTGFDPAQPIDAAFASVESDYVSPALVDSPGVTTTTANDLLVLHAGADWMLDDGITTFSPPLGFTIVDEIADRVTHWAWTEQSIATKVQADPGPTGQLHGTLASHDYSDGTTPLLGIGFADLFAIRPAPAPN